MNVERIGYLGYRLYILGWQNALHKNLNPMQHLIYSVFYYYRLGFVESSKCIKLEYFETKS